jgi:hypothetical protein
MALTGEKLDGQIGPIAVSDGSRLLLLQIAKRVFWWGTPEEWLNDAVRFGAQVMTFGVWDDVAAVWRIFGDKLFQQVLQAPPAGVFDLKSWTYWHKRYDLPVPPLPERNLGDGDLHQLSELEKGQLTEIASAQVFELPRMQRLSQEISTREKR